LLEEVVHMSDVPEDRQFKSAEEMLRFLKEHVDDIENVVIPVQEAVEVRGPQGERRVTNGVGAWIKLCGGNSMMISRDDAAMLINDGVLQRLRIKCVLDPLKK
jgi:hypothetical protein